MFDPFGDFDRVGYLRNTRQVKDAVVIKNIEHELFRLNLPLALGYLSAQPSLGYADFLHVHGLLFGAFYPWAGKDRNQVAPTVAISKGAVMFAHPADARRAVELGLSLARSPDTMLARLGEIMGLFAFGHPFLDGNGRTMLLVHMELCYRAGFSVRWAQTQKTDYLKALSAEIETPGQGVLDRYLAQFRDVRLEREQWGERILSIEGLDGLDGSNQDDADLSDPAVAERYRLLEQRRQESNRASEAADQ